MLGFLKRRMGWGERNHHCCECVEWVFAGFSEAENGVSVLSGCLLGFLKLRMG